MIKSNKIKISLLTCALAVLGSSQAFAQSEWPNKPIRLIVPYSAGGFTDLVARLVAKNVSESIGQPVTVDNKPGANSIIGVDNVAKSAPDGYTFGFILPAYVVNTSMYEKLPYNPEKDIQAVSLVGIAPLVAAVNKDSKFTNFKEIIDEAKKNPNKLSFGSSGNGSATHLSMLHLQSQTKTQFTHVPYKGTAPGITDLLGGRLDFMFTTPDAFLSMSKAGKLRMIGVASNERLPVISDVPTFKELGLGNFSANTWAGIIAPSGVSPKIIDKLSKEVANSLKNADLKKKFEEVGFVAVGSSPDEFKKFIAKETAQWSEIVKNNNIKAEN